MKKIVLGLALIIVGFLAHAQNGLENVYVERYYVADGIDSTHSNPPLPVGSVTYRVYADMLPGYKLQSIYGSPQHTLLINSTTEFFNQSDYGNSIPTISASNTKKNTVMIDSWLTTGGTCNGYLGIPKTEDNGVGNFVNSNVPPLLQNNASQAGIPLSTQDGMFSGTVPGTSTIGLDGIIDVFGDGSANGNEFIVTNGAWTCLTGALGPIATSNKVLIAQITTNGIFHFELNIQIGTPSGGTEKYVASDPGTDEITISSLIQTLYPVPVPPSVSITAPANGATFALGVPIIISADANDTDGTVNQVEFFVDGASIGVDITTPYTATNSGLSAASHILTARATDNEGLFTISSPVSIVINANQLPVVSITAPDNNATFTIGTAIAITADANDPDGTVNQVEFFIDGISLGIDVIAPYAVSYTGLVAASHILTCMATDNMGGFTLSVPVNIHIVRPSYNVTFNLDMSKETLSPNGVHIAGSFNNWNPSATPMVAGINSIYSVTLPLTEGQEYTYRFVNGNLGSGIEFVPDECGIKNGGGVSERFINIPTHDTIIDTVCFSMCSHCPIDIPVIFRVDMSNQVISPNGVHMAGGFNGWNTSATPMVAGANNVYSATLMLTPGLYQLYRFVNGNDQSGYETVPAQCGSSSASGGYDRYVTVPDSDTTLPVVCFSSCVDCGSSAQYVNVTFRVDMRHEIVSTNGVHIAGSFQGWQAGVTPMATVGDTVYTFTQLFLAGSTVQYKYVNGNTSNDFETVPASCSVSGSRFVLIPSTDTVLNLVCFSSCNACTPVTYVSVTFRVDMSEHVVSSSGLHLMAAFQGWNPATTAMTGAGGIYISTLQLPSNTAYEYRFVNGNTWNDAENVPEECALNGNRQFISSNDTLLPLVCFAKCGICDVGLTAEITPDDFNEVYPNPASNILNIEVSENSKIQLLDLNGKLIVAEQNVNANQKHTIDVSNVAAGVYMLKIYNDKFVKMQKVIVKK